MITGLIILYFIVGCILAYYWYKKDKQEWLCIGYTQYSEILLLVIVKIVCWPIVLLINIEI